MNTRDPLSLMWAHTPASGPYPTGGIESHQAVECRVEVRLIGDPPEAVGAIDVFEAFGLARALHMPYQCVRVLARPRSPGEGVPREVSEVETRVSLGCRDGLAGRREGHCPAALLVGAVIGFWQASCRSFFGGGWWSLFGLVVFVALLKWSSWLGT